MRCPPTLLLFYVLFVSQPLDAEEAGLQSGHRSEWTWKPRTWLRVNQLEDIEEREKRELSREDTEDLICLATLETIKQRNNDLSERVQWLMRQVSTYEGQATEAQAEASRREADLRQRYDEAKKLWEAQSAAQAEICALRIQVAESKSSPGSGVMPCQPSVGSCAEQCGDLGEATRQLQMCRKELSSYQTNCSKPRNITISAKLATVVEQEGRIFAFGNKADNWQASVKQCRQFGMQLMTVESEEENALVVRAWQELGTTDNSMWLAANDLARLGEYVWQTTGRRLNYTNLEEDSTPNRSRRCIVFNFSTGLWNIEYCNFHTKFICEEV